ncbi:MAG: helix-hairpin-helix domain-containing protein [Candidatus Microgenomates bacterium]|jgi:DNA polymerase (family 10)
MESRKILSNLQIAELLRDVAAAYELKDAKRYKFQIIAYERAGDAVEHATSELKDLWDDGKLTEVPGIGPGLAEHLDELFRTGKSKHFDSLMKDIPREAFKLMELPGIGIKTALKLIKEGNRSEIDKLLKQVSAREKKDKRFLLPYAAMVAHEVMEYLLMCSSVKRVDPLGSLRRQASTIGDIDIAVATDDPSKVLDYFVKYPTSGKTIEKGDHTASILLPGDIRVDLMTQSVDSYGALLQHFTGSKHHNIALREYALKKELSLSEYGIKNQSTGETKKFKDEVSFYKFLGLTYIQPELREDTGEIEAARQGKLPKLVELKDVKADLQIHSDFDIETSHDLGESSMEEIVKKGNELKYEYLAFTEHNPSQKGHNEKQIMEILKRKREKIDKLNYSIKNSHRGSVQKVFNSLEIDILPDGRLPVPEEGLQILDFALVSIHSSFDLNRDLMTKRVLSALSHPKVKIFAHPTARKLNEREGVELNWPEIFEFCLKNGKWIEINCDPMRLDLPDTLVKEAVKCGVKLTFGTDAHHKDGLNNMYFGVSVARRGWAEARDIINTRPLIEFEKLLKGGD